MIKRRRDSDGQARSQSPRLSWMASVAQRGSEGASEGTLALEGRAAPSLAPATQTVRFLFVVYTCMHAMAMYSRCWFHCWSEHPSNLNPFSSLNGACHLVRACLKSLEPRRELRIALRPVIQHGAEEVASQSRHARVHQQESIIELSHASRRHTQRLHLELQRQSFVRVRQFEPRPHAADLILPAAARRQQLLHEQHQI